MVEVIVPPEAEFLSEGKLIRAWLMGNRGGGPMAMKRASKKKAKKKKKGPGPIGP